MSLEREPLTLDEAQYAGYAASKLLRIRELQNGQPTEGIISVTVGGQQVAFPINADQAVAVLALLAEREEVALSSLGVSLEN